MRSVKWGFLDAKDGSQYATRMTRLPKGVREAMREAGRIFGREGGKARAKKLSPEQRSEIARRAVQARWARAKERKKRGGQ